MRMFTAITTAALLVGILPIACTTSGGSKEVTTNEVVPAPDAVIHISGLSCPF